MRETDTELVADLCGAALEYLTAGWPIVPTRHPAHTQLVCRSGPPDQASARNWWSDSTYGGLFSVTWLQHKRISPEINIIVSVEWARPVLLEN